MKIYIVLKWNKNNNLLYINSFSYKSIKWWGYYYFRLWETPIELDINEEYTYFSRDRNNYLQFNNEYIKELILNWNIKVEKNIFWTQYIDLPIEKDFDKIIEKYSINL